MSEKIYVGVSKSTPIYSSEIQMNKETIFSTFYNAWLYDDADSWGSYSSSSGSADVRGTFSDDGTFTTNDFTTYTRSLKQSTCNFGFGNQTDKDIKLKLVFHFEKPSCNEGDNYYLTTRLRTMFSSSATTTTSYTIALETTEEADYSCECTAWTGYSNLLNCGTLIAIEFYNYTSSTKKTKVAVTRKDRVTLKLYQIAEDGQEIQIGTKEISDVAVQPTKLYIGVNNIAKQVQRAYIGVNGIAQCCYTSPSYIKKVSWADGTDEEIAAMVAAADKGIINLADYWKVGDTRSIPIKYDVYTSYDDLVLMDTNCKGFTLASATSGGRTTPNFMVGFKNCLGLAARVFNSTTLSSDKWTNSEMRTWLNGDFKSYLPSGLLGIFKQFTWQQGDVSDALDTTTDYFGLPPLTTLHGTCVYDINDNPYGCYPSEDALYEQWTWYQTADNKVKYSSSSAEGGGYSSYSYWTASTPVDNVKTNMIYYTGYEPVSANMSTDYASVSPICCI